MLDNNPMNSLALFFALRELGQNQNPRPNHRTAEPTGLFTRIARLIRRAFAPAPAKADFPSTRLEMRRLKEAAVAARKFTRSQRIQASFATPAREHQQPLRKSA